MAPLTRLGPMGRRILNSRLLPGREQACAALDVPPGLRRGRTLRGR